MTRYSPPHLDPKEWSPWSQVSQGNCPFRPAVEPVPVDWVLRCPDAVAHEIAHKWIGGIGHIEVSADRARELLANPTWSALNPIAAAVFSPPLPPVPEFPTLSVNYSLNQPVNGNLARIIKAKEKREKVRSSLLKAPARSDRLVAQELGVARPLVREVRKELEASRSIQKIDPSERKSLPRPLKYKTQRQKVQEIAAQTKAWREKVKK